ncbi:MAG: hypothetical protein ABSG32_10290 [Terriglobia bacterium]|jgi:hypothetical protein
MFSSFRSFPQNLRLFALIVVAGGVLVSCGPTTNQPAGGTSAYDRAKDAFKSGQLDKALDLTDKLATATPPVDSTDRARVLRAVIYTGELKSAKELAETYSKGAEKAKNPRFQADYRRLHNDSLANAAKAALNLAETAHQIAPDGAIAKELTLEASYPTTEGPAEVKLLAHVEEGGWIEPDEQESAAADALRKGIDDALADVVSGDRAKARQALAGGSTQLDGAAFAIFLAKELAEGAVIFDRHHSRDPQKLITLCDEGEESLKAALALLKDTPDKDQEKEAKKLQDKFTTIRKDK